MANSHLKTAHEWGVQQALQQAGFDSVEAVYKEAAALGLLEKAAADGHPGLGAGVGGLLGPVGGMAGAGIGAESGHRLSAMGGAGVGSVMGGAAGGLGGAGIGHVIAKLMETDPERARALGAALGIPLGAYAGGIMGARHGGGTAGQ